MWWLLWPILAALLLSFSFVLLAGAPYLPTLSPQINTALKLVDLQQGQTLLELGSGDGRVLFAAAEQGIHAIGYELNPLLVVYSKIRARKYRGLVTVRWGNFWHQTWPEADGVFVFLLAKYMKKLDNKIVQEYNGQKIKVVSFAFRIPGRVPQQQTAGLYMYQYK
jgi:SAM-dependent methyltransferase